MYLLKKDDEKDAFGEFDKNIPVGSFEWVRGNNQLEDMLKECGYKMTLIDNTQVWQKQYIANYQEEANLQLV